jgi:hypothetical protein
MGHDGEIADVLKVGHELSYFWPTASLLEAVLWPTAALLEAVRWPTAALLEAL